MCDYSPAWFLADNRPKKKLGFPSSADDARELQAAITLRHGPTKREHAHSRNTPAIDTFETITVNLPEKKTTRLHFDARLYEAIWEILSEPTGLHPISKKDVPKSLIFFFLECTARILRAAFAPSSARGLSAIWFLHNCIISMPQRD